MDGPLVDGGRTGGTALNFDEAGGWATIPFHGIVATIADFGGSEMGELGNWRGFPRADHENDRGRWCNRPVEGFGLAGERGHGKGEGGSRWMEWHVALPFSGGIRGGRWGVPPRKKTLVPEEPLASFF